MYIISLQRTHYPVINGSCRNLIIALFVTIKICWWSSIDTDTDTDTVNIWWIYDFVIVLAIYTACSGLNLHNKSPQEERMGNTQQYSVTKEFCHCQLDSIKNSNQ